MMKTTDTALQELLEKNRLMWLTWGSISNPSKTTIELRFYFNSFKKESSSKLVYLLDQQTFEYSTNESRVMLFFKGYEVVAVKSAVWSEESMNDLTMELYQLAQNIGSISLTEVEGVPVAKGAVN